MCHVAHWRHLANTIELAFPSALQSPQPKRHLDRSAVFAGLTSVTDRPTDRQTDRPTDHATRSVTIGRIYVGYVVRAMRPNNKLIIITSGQSNST